MKSRREFLKAAGALAASGLLIGQFGCKPGHKAETAVATDMAASGADKKIGLQLYTLRNDISSDGIESVLQRVSKIGYKWMEGFGYEDRKILGKTPQEMKSLVEGLGMTMPSCHAVTEVSTTGGKQAIMDQMKTTADDIKAAGCEYLVWAFLQEKDRKTLDDYKRHIDTWNEFGQVCKDTGIQFAYHNHWFEFEDLEGQKPYDMILAGTDPELVKLEMDLYWIIKAGADPLVYFNKAPGRFPMWHVKDMDNTPEKDFTEVGNGVIDFARIFAERDKAGMKYFFVEQDQTKKTPFESIEISYKYLQQAKFV